MLPQQTHSTTSSIIHVPKKRGRPKKNTTMPPRNDSSIIGEKKKDFDDEIILHIPLYDVETPDSNTKVISVDDQINISSSSSSDCKNISIEELITELKKKDVIIKKLKKSLSDGHLSHDITSLATKDNKKHYLDIKLINVVDGKLIIADKTDIACWWCTYNFDTTPCFIPERYVNNKYYVFGCFCSFSCAYAYNQNMNDYKVHVRNSLLNQMYSTIFEIKTPIPIAPPKEMLEKFGGELTIEQFRDPALLIKKEFRITIPPMVPLIPIIDEVTHDINPRIR
jgi:hypothetical protein